MVFRHLLQHWLQTTAQQKIRETVTAAAREKLAEMGEAQQAEDQDVSCDVGVVFALGIEAGGLVDLMDSVVTARPAGFVARRGNLRGRKVILVESGAGPARAARATEALIAGHQPPWVISAGFAGALQPELKRYDIVMADAVSDRGDWRLATDLAVDPAGSPPGVRVGRLLSVDEVVRLPSEKQALGQRHGAAAVDLESFATAEVCRHRGTRFLAIRILTDAMDEQLPADVQRLSDQPTTAARLGAALGAVWRRPSSFKDMMALKETALVGSDRLAKFLAGVIETLVPLPPAQR
jgi:adenosylhomocysteine nucleosidase